MQNISPVPNTNEGRLQCKDTTHNKIQTSQTSQKNLQFSGQVAAAELGTTESLSS
jgi:hypothetical protein